MTANIRKEKDASELANYAAVVEQACEWTMDAQKKTGGERRANKNEGPSVTYHLAARLSVPSRNDDQVIEVARIDLKPGRDVRPRSGVQPAERLGEGELEGDHAQPDAVRTRPEGRLM